MAMEFTYKVSGVKVYSETGKADIIKEATLHIIGTEGDETFENFLPIELAEPPGSFKEFSEVSEAQVIEWLRKTHGEGQIDAMKEGMASMYNNPNSPVNTSRANPQEKELAKS